MYQSLLNELRPEWEVEIIEEDYNLYKLGFVSDIPCVLEVNVSQEQWDELFEEIIDMEVGVYLEDLLLKSPWRLTEEEKKLRRKIKALEKEYQKFARLEGLKYCGQM